MQTVFLEACRACSRNRGEGSPGAFVGGITVRVARRAMHGAAFARRRSDLPEELASSADGSEEDLAARQRFDRVLHALSAARSRIFYAQKELREMAERDPALRESLEGGRR